MRRHLRLLWALARNDWRLFLADRRAAALCFIVPILLASAFGVIFDRPGQRLGDARLPLLLVLEDDSPAARALIDDLVAGGRIDGRIVDRASAERAVESRSCGVAVVIRKGFDRTPAIELIHHPLAGLESQWAEGVLTEAIVKRRAETMLAPMGVPQSAIANRPFDLMKTSPTGASDKFNSYSHSFCGMTLQYLLFWGLESGLLYLRERQRGLWKRMRAAPVPLLTALLGRALATGSIAFLQLLVTFAFGRIVFGVTIDGSWLAFLGLAIGVSLLAAATGLGVAAIGGTEARARSAFIVVILGVSMLGGLWLPAFLLPAWVQDLARALPTTWAMRGLDGVTWQGRPFAALAPSLGAVFGFAAGLFGLALVWFRRTDRLRRRGAIA